jgi:dCMP deaminase
MVNWNKRFLELSEHIATWSKDKSVGICAIIASSDNRILSIGYNGFPSGCDDSKPERYERPDKYLWTEHAERNAIYNAVRNGINIRGSIMYLRWFPCADCARAIIQSGIAKVVCDEPDINDERWGKHFEVAIQMFKECGVCVEYVR